LTFDGIHGLKRTRADRLSPLGVFVIWAVLGAPSAVGGRGWGEQDVASGSQDLIGELVGEKIPPQEVAAAALDALAAGAPEALVDDLARTVKAGLSDDQNLIYPGLREQFAAVAGRSWPGRLRTHAGAPDLSGPGAPGERFPALGRDGGQALVDELHDHCPFADSGGASLD
jgi:hypothetical protein